MARVKFGSLVSDISGSIGSSTFQKSLYGNTLRTKPRNRRSATPLQQSRRNTMMLLHQAWTALTDAQRTQWNQFISFSGSVIRRDKYTLQTGHSLFIQYNFLRNLSGLSILTVPTHINMPAWPHITDMEASAPSEFNISFSADPSDNNLQQIFKISAPRPPAQSFNPRGVLYMFVISTGDSFINIAQKYTDVFGALPAVGQTVHYEVLYYSILAPLISPTVQAKFIINSL